jgi:hypothetical protein
MVSLTQLWLPILLSAVFVFIVSSILHMVIPIHKGDCKKMPGEDKVLDAMRAQGLQPGSYMFPGAENMKDCGTPEMIEKYKRGPVGHLIVVPSGGINMGKSLMQWFLYTVLVGVLCAYIAAHTFAAGAPYLSVFRITGTAAMLAYSVGSIPESIWKGVSWTITAKFIFDGILYGLVTAGTFGWLWPAAAAAAGTP